MRLERILTLASRKKRRRQFGWDDNYLVSAELAMFSFVNFSNYFRGKLYLTCYLNRGECRDGWRQLKECDQAIPVIWSTITMLKAV